MKTVIVSYGTYLPAFALTADKISKEHTKSGQLNPWKSLEIKQKTVANVDEDAVTLATQSAWRAVERWSGDVKKIQALFIGSESHPYAVKPTGTIVKQALGLADTMSMADLQFACKAGTQALQTALAHVESGLAEVGLAVGSDTAQSEPGDVLEFTAGVGSAAFIVGKDKALVEVVDTISMATDTPDFWRRPGQSYPQHAGRFTGEPAYFKHVFTTAKQILDRNQLTPADIDYCIFHTPNGKFPRVVAQRLGFSFDQLKPSLVVEKIGNTYAAASLIALAGVLDQASANELILLTSYGSGAGSDSFLFRTTQLLPKFIKNQSDTVDKQISVLTQVSYRHL